MFPVNRSISSRTYRASNDKKDDVVPASNNLSHIHKLILEIQKKFKDQEQERKQMEVENLLERFSQFFFFSRALLNKMPLFSIQAKSIRN